MIVPAPPPVSYVILVEETEGQKPIIRIPKEKEVKPLFGYPSEWGKAKETKPTAETTRCQLIDVRCNQTNDPVVTEKIIRKWALITMAVLAFLVWALS